MKIRTGFVSNSSSSSFIVAHKGKKPTAASLVEHFGAKPKTAAAKLLEMYISKLIDGAVFENKNDYLEDMGYTEEEGEEYCKDVLKLFKDGWKVSRIRVASDQSDDLPQAHMREIGDLFEIDTDNLKIEFEG